MENQRPTLEQVEQALSAAYGSGATNTSRNLAEQWLLKFQQTNEAWNISILLLKLKNNIISQHFGAQTLEIKLRRDWGQLNRDQQFDLLRILLQHLKMFSEGPAMVLIRLCVAIAQAAINLVPKDWPKMFEDLFPLSQPVADPTAIDPRYAFLELWRVFPEEVSTAAITEEQRKTLMSYIFSLVPTMMPILDGFIRTEVLPLKVKAMKCLLSWINAEIPIGELLKLPILGTIYECIESINITSDLDNLLAELITDGSDVLSAVVQSNTMTKYPSAVRLMLQKAITLFPKYRTAVKVDDYRVARAFCSLFSTCCEQHVGALIKEKELGIPLIKILIECSANPDQDIATLTSSFWFEFQETLINDYDERTQKEFSEAFVEFVKILRNQALIPEDIETMSTHDIDEFRAFRTTLGDSFLDAYRVINKTTLDILITGLQTQLNTDNNNWRAIESYLFGIWSVSEMAAIDMKLSDYIRPIMDSFPVLPMNKFLYQIAIKVLGEYAKWLKKHPEYIPRAIQFTMASLNEPYLASAAAKTFNYLTKSLQASIGQQDLALLDVASKALMNENLLKESKDRCFVMEALSIVILTKFPLDQAAGMLRGLTAPVIERLKNTLQIQQPTTEQKDLIRSDLKTFAHAFYSFSTDADGADDDGEYDEDVVKIKLPPNAANMPHPFLPALQEAWPVVEVVAQHYGKNEKMVDTLYKLFLQLTTSLSKVQFQVLLPSTLNIIFIIYSRNHSAAILKLFSALLALYRIPSNVEKQMIKPELQLSQQAENEFTQKFAELFVLISKTTIDTVQKEVQSWPELVKTYFDLLVVIKKTNALIIYGPQNVPIANSQEPASLIWIVYQFALALILRLPHPTASRAVLAFLKEYCSEDDARFVPVMAQIMQKSIPQLLANLFKAVSGGLSRQMFQHIAQVIYVVSSKYTQQYISDLTILFELEGFPSKYVSKEHKTKILKQLFSALHDCKAIESTLHEIDVVCRNKGSK
jgi:hypothetical protein